ncbi:MAG: putative aminohydrolase SsnA [Candidatus Promineifilaceae bacterium]|nr:putative aminohydrolase SsnA [Candidatus Promineifilaceae bacterium]
MNLLFTDVTIFTNDEDNQILTDHAVAVEGSRIVAVGPEADLRERFAAHERVAGGGRLLMPGLVNAHMHFYGTFARGLALPRQPRNFAQILDWLWWTLDKALDLDGVYYSALLPALLGVRKGVTTFIDHHASPNAVAGSLDQIEAALRVVGARGLLCYEVSDRDGKAVRDKGLEENARYIRKCRGARAEDPDYLYDGMLGLHASFTLDEDTLAQAADLAAELERGHHIHVLEGTLDEEETQRKYGVGVAERLADFGIFGPRSIAAHGIYLDEHGMDLVAEADTIVAHNPQSNMNNAVGRADVFALLERGVAVGIGTDGMTPDLKVDVRTGHLLHKHHLSDPTLGWNQFQRMTLKNNPAIYRRLTGQKVGRVEPGYLADLILVDYFPPTPLDGDNFWGHFLFGIADAPVDTTVINGRIVMRDKVIPGVDEAEIARASQRVARQVWRRFEVLSQ